MLARLSSAVPSATACIARSACAIPRLPCQVRFNSSEAEPSDGQVAAPKKRAIPIAESLGGISISNRPRQGGQRRNGNGDRDRRPRGRGDANPNPQQLRLQTAREKDSDVVRTERHDGQRNGQRDGPRNGQRDGQRNGQRTNQWNGQRDGQRPPRQQNQAQSAQVQDAPQAQASQQQQQQRRPSQARSEPETQEEPITLPTAQKIELGNLDDLFGPSSARPSTQGIPQTAKVTKQLSPSQDRIQTFLERTAGDYSRYVPQPLPTTDVTKLSSLELGEFVLSKRRDVGLRSRQSALTVIEKFPGTKNAPAPSS